MGGDKWTKVKVIQTAGAALRLPWPNENQDEGQTRDWERLRPGPSPENTENNPPRYDPRLAYGNSQRLQSDPGPHDGNGSWPQQGLPSSSYNQDYQGAQYRPSSGPQGNFYQGTNSQAYGPNQGAFAPQPPASYPPYNPPYPQQSIASAGQSYQGGQSSYHYPYPQGTGQPASSSHSPPLDPRLGSQNPQASNQSPNFPEQSYHPRSTGGSLSRTVTAPASLHCEHGYPRY